MKPLCSTPTNHNLSLLFLCDAQSRCKTTGCGVSGRHGGWSEAYSRTRRRQSSPASPRGQEPNAADCPSHPNAAIRDTSLMRDLTEATIVNVKQTQIIMRSVELFFKISMSAQRCLHVVDSPQTCYMQVFGGLPAVACCTGNSPLAAMPISKARRGKAST